MSASSRPMLGSMTGGSSGEHHLDFKPVDTSKTEDALRAAETACQLAIQHIPEEVEASEELLRYPEDEADAVTITERDMEELQPGKFLGDSIVDFYIRYLERSLPPERRERFYFFNSFFFRKLLQSSAPTRIDPCKVDYEQLRRWTEKVNLFEKDYVFIPIVKSSHWSLIIICHLSSLTCATEKMVRLPCVFHLDPIEGQHESFEGLIRSYVLQAWMERFQSSIDKDQLLALYQMKYVQAKVPQQVNCHDCGLYVLNYIEAILIKSTSLDFNFVSIERGVQFTSPDFTIEILGKRRHIQDLILEHIQISQEHTKKHLVMKSLVQELLQASQNLQSFLYHEGYSKACIKDVQLLSPTISNSGDCKITHASKYEDSMDVQHQHSTLKSMGNNELLSGPQNRLGFEEYQNRSESLSPKLQHVELKIQTVGDTTFKGPICEAKHASIHEDSIHVQHQQSSKLSKLDFEQLDGHELGQAIHQVVIESFSNKLEDIPRVDPCKPSKGTNKRRTSMTHQETSVLLSCKLEGGHFCKGSGGATHWNLISEEIEKKLGSRPSLDQCRLRYDTLLKAYKTYEKYCMKTGKMFSAITEEERLDLKVATTLCEEWYTTIGKICDKAKSRKRIKINRDVCNDLHPLSSHDSPAPNPTPISHGRSFEDEATILNSVCGTSEVPLHNFFLGGVLSSLNEDLLSTLFNLVQESTSSISYMKIFYNLGLCCRTLAILQDREWSEILNYVFMLWELKLLEVEDMNFEEAKDLVPIDLWEDKSWSLNSWVYEEISKEVLCKNPHLKIYYYGLSIEQSSLQYIKVLSLDVYCKLKHLDLRKFPSLQVLVIPYCQVLPLVTGWEVATNLQSIRLNLCNFYLDFSNLQYLCTLKECAINGWSKAMILHELSQFSQCTKLRRLEIWNAKSSSKFVDLKSLKDLKFLEFLSLRSCKFSNINGLSGLQSLKTLHLQSCRNLRGVHDLECLKGLTKLDLSCSGIVDVLGVRELHLLTSIHLYGCKSLKWLPFLGHLKALVYLDLNGTGVKEIPGKEELISLKTLRMNIKRRAT